jgi:TATA-box binding protein (TBP) (component of TFIID and TFIIIB)
LKDKVEDKPLLSFIKEFIHYLFMALGSNYKIQIYVATASLETVPLTKLADSTQPNTEYNPETFPGLVLR